MNIKVCKIIVGSVVLIGTIIINIYFQDQWTQNVGSLVAGFLFGSTTNGKQSP